MPKQAPHQLPFPTKGKTEQEIKQIQQEARKNDARWQDGRTFSLVFYAGPDVARVSQEAYLAFYQENGLNLSAFPSIRKFETEVVSMSASLLNGDNEVVGNMMSGGTESIICVVKTAVNKAKKEKPGIKPEIIAPASVHPAFDKACNYFDVKLIHVPVREDDKRADVEAMEKAINENTIMLIGSAPAYPHGVVDPIEELGRLAQQHHLLLHVDACVGGYMLPFVERLGYKVPPFDFRVPGVTSMSMDVHKYGYATKGTSVLLYRNAEIRRHQYFVYLDWTGGIYASPSVTGTRPGGTFASAWAVMNYLGEEGYLRIAKEVMDATEKVKQKVATMDGIYIMANPHMSVLALASDKHDIFRIGDELNIRGWHLDKQQHPNTLHMTISYGNVQAIDQFLLDLEASMAEVRKFHIGELGDKVAVGLVKGLSAILPEKQMSKLTQAAAKMGGTGVPKRSAAMYGMMGALPNEGDVKDLVISILEGMNSLEPKEE